VGERHGLLAVAIEGLEDATEGGALDDEGLGGPATMRIAAPQKVHSSGSIS